MTGASTVYRCYDAEGRLIYVGCTGNLEQRLRGHRNSSWWSVQIADVRTTDYPTAIEGRIAEREAIRTEHPRWNTQGRVVLTVEHATDVATSIESSGTHSSQALRRAEKLRRKAMA